MCKILKWFKHDEVVNTETEGDRRARAAFHAEVADKEPKKEFGIMPAVYPATPNYITNRTYGTVLVGAITNIHLY
jgi:hypothetical protein